METETVFDKGHPDIDVIIPVYRPDKRLAQLLAMLEKQTCPVSRIIIIKTEKDGWNEGSFRKIPNLEIHYLTKEEFDHGATRNLAAGYSKADIMIFMTDDAVPQDNRLVERLAAALDQRGPKREPAAVAYARQLPDDRTVHEEFQLSG